MTKKLTREEWDRIKLIDFDSMDATQSKEVLSLLLNMYPATQETLYLVRALTNPLTREWADDKFIEEEKKFHFILKDTRDSKDGQYHLVKNGKGAIILYPFGGADKPAFKESEIIKWGFNSEAFDREEV